MVYLNLDTESDKSQNKTDSASDNNTLDDVTTALLSTDLSTDGVNVTHSPYAIVVKFKVAIDDDLHIADTIC